MSDDLPPASYRADAGLARQLTAVPYALADLSHPDYFGRAVSLIDDLPDGRRLYRFNTDGAILEAAVAGDRVTSSRVLEGQAAFDLWIAHGMQLEPSTRSAVTGALTVGSDLQSTVLPALKKVASIRELGLEVTASEHRRAFTVYPFGGKFYRSAVVDLHAVGGRLLRAELLEGRAAHALEEARMRHTGKLPPLGWETRGAVARLRGMMPIPLATFSNKKSLGLYFQKTADVAPDRQVYSGPNGLVVEATVSDGRVERIVVFDSESAWQAGKTIDGCR